MSAGCTVFHCAQRGRSLFTRRPGGRSAFEAYAIIVRAVIALLMIIPVGLLMGFGFPTGMRLVSAIDSRPTPWFWAINGAAGVLAASIAVAVSIAFSINVCIWIGAACYLPLGIAAIALMNRPASNSMKI